MTSKKPTRITVSLGDAEHAELQALSEKYDVSLSWLARKAIVELLKTEAGKETQFNLQFPANTKGREI